MCLKRICDIKDEMNEWEYNRNKIKADHATKEGIFPSILALLFSLIILFALAKIFIFLP